MNFLLPQRRLFFQFFRGFKPGNRPWKIPYPSAPRVVNLIGLLLILSIFSIASLKAKTAYVDFGLANTSGTINGSYWNVWNPGNSTVLIDIDGATSTGWNLASTTAAATNNGTVPDFVATYATNGAPVPFNHDTITSDALNLTSNQTTRNVRLSGLNSTNSYNFQIYGAREASDTRVTNYTIRGTNSTNGSLTTSGNGIGTNNANYNNNNILSINGIYPDASGQIFIEYSVGSGTNGYLNAFTVTEVIAPQPTPTPTPTPTPPSNKKKLVIAGSSVPNGYGSYGPYGAGSYTNDFDQKPMVNEDTFGLYGYAGRLRLLLTNPSTPTNPHDSTTNWIVENVSIGGNNTPLLLARFNPDVTRQYAPPKVSGTEPDYVLIGLSMGNEGLVYGDPEQTFTSYKNGLLQLIQECRTRGYYPVVASVYPHGLYTFLKYQYVKRMNLLMGTWGVPVINLLGAIDDGNGRWADGTAFINRLSSNGTATEDPAHPNVVGHEEMFLAIPPTLFDAIEAGKNTVPTFPSGAGFARLTATPGDKSPLTFTPAHPMHSFTHSFRVRSTGNGTVAAVRSATKPLFLVDFGPSNDDAGRSTQGPDPFGRYWNSWRPQQGGLEISIGTTLANMTTVDNAASSVGLQVTGNFTGSNGTSDGGLTTPHSALLGQLAVPTATEDYFFDSDDNAGFKVTGLDPARKYTFRFLCSRQSATREITRVTLDGGLTYKPYCDVVTSGPRISKNGLSNGNDHLIGVISSMPPKANGEIAISLLSNNSTTAYLGLMEISVDNSSTRFGTVELRNGTIAYVASHGEEITAPIDGDNGTWHDIALSHRYARQETLLYVDGILAGRIRENLIPDQFVLGGPGDSGRAAAPVVADCQDWCVNRAAWTDEEAEAQHRGQLQHASLEILAPLDDLSFPMNAAANNTAQSLSQAMIRTANMTSGPLASSPAPLSAVSFARSSVELTWQDTSALEAGYSIQRRLSGTASPWENAGTTAANATTFTDTGLIPGAQYEYRVAAITGSLQGEWSNIVQTASGINGRSYSEWSAEYFALPQTTYRIDFNTAAGNYGGEVWNRVSSLSPGQPLALLDATGSSAAGYKLTVTGGFEQCLTGNGSVLTGYPADAQNSCFIITNQTQPGGAQLILSGLNRKSNYNINLFGRIAPTTPGSDYRGRYTVQGNGSASSFEKGIDNNTQLFVTSLPPDEAGNIIINLSAPDFPTGPVTTGISFLVLEEIPERKLDRFLIDFNGNSTITNYPAGEAWNRIGNLTDTTPRTLVNTSNSTSANVTFQLASAFYQARVGTALPGGFADDAESTMFNAMNSGSTIVIGGLDPATPYDLTFLSRRGSVVADFDYTANCTVTGAVSTTLVVDGAAGIQTTMARILPSQNRTISFKIAAGPGTGTDFPVLNLISLSPSVDVAQIGQNEDLDGDGLTNLTEYALGLNPLVSNAVSFDLKDTSLNQAHGTLEFSHTRPASARDANWILESTGSLAHPANWQIDPQARQAVVQRNGTLETIRHSRSVASEGQRFFRLRLVPAEQP